MTKIRWFFNRLRTMSVGEVAHRTARTLANRWQRIRVASGWAPGGNSRLIGSRSLFAIGGSDCDQVIASWRSRFTLDAEGVEQLLQGRLPMFGEVFDVGRTVDWHLDPKTGRRAPLIYGAAIDYRQPEIVGDIKVLWEVARHQHLIPLAVAYAVEGNERCGAAVSQQIDSWIETNPYAIGIHWCSAMEVGLRAIAWSMTHSLLALRDPEGLLGLSRCPQSLARAIFQHGYFIERNLSRYSSANNHLIGELVGLLCLATVFDFGPTSVRWQALAREQLEREIDAQVWSDGVAKEQAVQYQLELLDYFTFAACLAQLAGNSFPQRSLDRIRNMARFLRAMQPDGGDLPQIGDSDEGVVNRFDPSSRHAPQTEILGLVESMLGDSSATPTTSERAFWYRQIADLQAGNSTRETKCSTRASEPIVTFPEGGYAVVRCKPLHIVFDAGPLGYLSIAAHGHADALSFCAAWRGQWWLVDPGTYAYHGDPVYRAYFRGTAAHNTATVNGMDQSLQGGAFMWLTHAPARVLGSGPTSDGFWVEGTHDGYRRMGVAHHRRMEVCGTSDFRVVDSFDLESDAEQRVDLNFHFHPDVMVELKGIECTATRQGYGDALRLKLDDAWTWRSLRGSQDPLAGWYSSRLGHKEPCWTLRGSRVVDRDTRVVTGFLFEPSAGSS